MLTRHHLTYFLEFAAASVFACACGRDALLHSGLVVDAGSPGPPATFTFDAGRPAACDGGCGPAASFVARGGVSHLYPPQNGTGAMIVVLDDHLDACAAALDYAHGGGKTIDSSSIVLLIYSTAPGTYAVGRSYLWFATPYGQVQTLATQGLITLTRADDTVIEGSYDVTLGGERLRASFSAPHCGFGLFK